MPVAEQMPERLPAVLATLYLIFNEGYLASSSEALVRTELSGEAIRLTRVLVAMLPREPEARGLLALMLLTDARRAARVDEAGELVLLEDQDRALWDRELIAEGLELSREAAAERARSARTRSRPASPRSTPKRRAPRRPTGRGSPASTPGICELAPSPVVELNRAVAVAMAEGPERGLELIEAIEGLDGYQPLHSARADLLRRLGREAEATRVLRQALELTANPVERRFIERRLAQASE